MEKELNRKIIELDKTLNLFPTKIVVNLNEAQENYAEVYYSYMSHSLEKVILCVANHVFAQLFSARLPLSKAFMYTANANAYPEETLSAEQVKQKQLYSMVQVTYIKIESLEEGLNLLIDASRDMLVPLFLRHNERFVLLNAQDLFKQNGQGNLNKPTLLALSELCANYDREMREPEFAIADLMDSYKNDVALMPEKRKAEQKLYDNLKQVMDDYEKKPYCDEEEIDGWREEELSELDGDPLSLNPDRF